MAEIIEKGQVISLRNDSKANWRVVENSAILERGEVGIAYDEIDGGIITSELRVGDGIHPWKDLVPIAAGDDKIGFYRDISSPISHQQLFSWARTQRKHDGQSVHIKEVCFVPDSCPSGAASTDAFLCEVYMSSSNDGCIRAVNGSTGAVYTRRIKNGVWNTGWTVDTWENNIAAGSTAASIWALGKGVHENILLANNEIAGIATTSTCTACITSNPEHTSGSILLTEHSSGGIYQCVVKDGIAGKWNQLHVKTEHKLAVHSTNATVRSADRKCIDMGNGMFMLYLHLMFSWNTFPAGSRLQAFNDLTIDGKPFNSGIVLVFGEGTDATRPTEAAGTGVIMNGECFLTTITTTDRTYSYNLYAIGTTDTIVG